MLIAEPALEALVENRVGELVTAALAEDAADQSRDRHQILEREPGRAPGHPDRGVLAGQHGQRVEWLLGLRDIGVDSIHVAGRVGEDLRLSRLAVAHLVLEVLLCVGLIRPDALVHRHVGASGKCGKVALPGMPKDVDEEQPILGGCVTDSEHQRRPRGAVDVRHTEPFVADDRDAGLRTLAAGRVARRNSERGVLEIVRDRRRRDRTGRGGQPRVHLELIRAMRWTRTCSSELGELHEVVKPVRPRRQHVPKPAVVTCAVGLYLRSRGRDHHEREQCGE